MAVDYAVKCTNKEAFVSLEKKVFLGRQPSIPYCTIKYTEIICQPRKSREAIPFSSYKYLTLFQVWSQGAGSILRTMLTIREGETMQAIYTIGVV